MLNLKKIDGFDPNSFNQGPLKGLMERLRRFTARQATVGIIGITTLLGGFAPSKANAANGPIASNRPTATAKPSAVESKTPKPAAQISPEEEYVQKVSHALKVVYPLTKDGRAHTKWHFLWEAHQVIQRGDGEKIIQRAATKEAAKSAPAKANAAQSKTSATVHKSKTKHQVSSKTKTKRQKTLAEIARNNAYKAPIEPPAPANATTTTSQAAPVPAKTTRTAPTTTTTVISQLPANPTAPTITTTVRSQLPANPAGALRGEQVISKKLDADMNHVLLYAPLKTVVLIQNGLNSTLLIDFGKGKVGVYKHTDVNQEDSKTSSLHIAHTFSQSISRPKKIIGPTDPAAEPLMNTYNWLATLSEDEQNKLVTKENKYSVGDKGAVSSFKVFDKKALEKARHETISAISPAPTFSPRTAANAIKVWWAEEPTVLGIYQSSRGIQSPDTAPKISWSKRTIEKLRETRNPITMRLTGQPFKQIQYNGL